MNNSEPYVKLDEDAYIIMPKGAQFSDVSYKKTESAKGKKKVARLAYTYAGHEVGSVDIVKTGAKVKDNYYVNTDSGQKKMNVSYGSILHGSLLREWLLSQQWFCCFWQTGI